MLSQDRQALILDIIKEQGSITVTRLTEILETSESTVRRDLSFLANKGKFFLTHKLFRLNMTGALGKFSFITSSSLDARTKDDFLNEFSSSFS